MHLKADVEENLPLTETTFLILVCLAPEPMHGYAIMKEVQALSRDRIRLSTGTLYGALKRLLRQCWIGRAGEEEPSAGPGPGRARRFYALTNLGRRMLEAEVARLEELAAVGRLRTSEARP